MPVKFPSITVSGGATGGGSTADDVTIGIGEVALDKLPDVPASTVLGRGSLAGPGSPQELTLGAGLLLTGTVLSSTAVGGSPPTGTGFRHVTAGVEDAAAKLVETADVADDQVTFAKVQNVATARVLGRASSGSGNIEELTGAQATALLDVATSGAKGLAPASGGGTTNFLRADLTWAAPPGGGASPDWHGNIYAAFNDCDPKVALKLATMSGSVAATPTNVSLTVARVAYFRPPADITVHKIRFFGVGATTQFRIAIYNGDTLARLIAAQSVTTAAQAWGSVGSGLGLALTAGQLYFAAVSAVATSTTAGMLCIGPSVADTTGRIGALPKGWPGGLDLDAGFIDGAYAQFAVTNGVLPDPAPTIAAQAAWTGGFPLLFLDNNNA